MLNVTWPNGDETMRNTQFANAVTNLLGHHQRAANGCFGQNHRKVLATEAGDGIGRAFRMPADGVGDPAQAVVASQMAIGIVEQLEEVDVAHQRGDRLECRRARRHSIEKASSK